MPTRFNPPPNWPRPPAGWVPPDGWQPNPAWGPPPAGWTYWIEEPAPKPEPEPIRTPNPSTDRSGGPRVFISYRRSDCQAQANGLYDGLSHRLPGASVFMDIDSIPPGADFEQHIRREIEICDLVLVLIGDNWLDRSGDGSGRRIDTAGDFVRLEIESALASPRVKVLPVLVEGARMPSAAELPESVRPLARINAMELDDRRWTADLRRLASTVEALTQPAGPPTPAPTPMPPTPPAPTPAPQPSARSGRTGAAVVGWLMIAVPVLSFGLATFVPGLWAGIRRRNDRAFRNKMFVFAAAVGLASFVAIGVIGSTDRESVASDVGVAVWLACVVLAVVVAAVTRKAATDLPAVGAELRRRRERDEYRRLVRNDPGLARSLAVGRPDVQRSYSDGGLLDLNALPVVALVEFGPMSTDDAQRIVARRQQLGRLTSLDDLASAGVTAGTLDRLRENAVFL
jgi:DNA uptake protein ComE-like DNA-binding protein